MPGFSQQFSSSILLSLLEEVCIYVVDQIMAPQCSALNVSDQSRCDDEATSVNGLFCSFHSKQCQGILPCQSSFNLLAETISRSL